MIVNGAQIDGKVRIKLPQPTMPDGADAAARKAAYATFVDENKNPLDALMMPNTTAPFEIRVRDVDTGDPNVTVKGVDMWFFVHSKFDAVLQPEFRRTLMRLAQGSFKHRDLSAEDLQKRKIVLEPNAGIEEQGYVQRIFTLFDKVEVNETNLITITRTADSLVVATMLDPRFVGDPEFPCQWKPLTINEDGSLEAGAPKPYSGFGYYLKATRLAEPEGVIFFEVHFVCQEPKSWFDGANLVQSKLPLVLQGEVRRIRRELAAASR
jgi:hypothetical protein